MQRDNCSQGGVWGLPPPPPRDATMPQNYKVWHQRDAAHAGSARRLATLTPAWQPRGGIKQGEGEGRPIPPQHCCPGRSGGQAPSPLDPPPQQQAWSPPTQGTGGPRGPGPGQPGLRALFSQEGRIGPRSCPLGLNRSQGPPISSPALQNPRDEPSLTCPGRVPLGTAGAEVPGSPSPGSTRQAQSLPPGQECVGSAPYGEATVGASLGPENSPCVPRLGTAASWPNPPPAAPSPPAGQGLLGAGQQLPSPLLKGPRGRAEMKGGTGGPPRMEGSRTQVSWVTHLPQGPHRILGREARHPAGQCPRCPELNLEPRHRGPGWCLPPAGRGALAWP